MYGSLWLEVGAAHGDHASPMCANELSNPSGFVVEPDKH